MVLTRSMGKACGSIGSDSGATLNASNSSHGADTVVHGDMARVAVDKHASARSRRTKSNSALQKNISTEDKSACTRTRATVPKSDKGERPIGRKSSRGTKPQHGHQATKQSRGSKSKKSLAGPSAEPIVKRPQIQHHTSRSGKAGTKRNREADDDAPESEVALRANAPRVRRRVDGPADRAERCNPFIPEIPLENEDYTSSSCQIPRRSARLASKTSNTIPRGQCSSTDDVDRVMRLKRRILDALEDVSTKSLDDLTFESKDERPVLIPRRSPQKAHRTEAEQIRPLQTEQDWPLIVVHERHPPFDSVTSAYIRNRESTEPRSSSVESLLTPPPPSMEEEEQVLLHQDFDAMIPLDSIPDDDERDAMNQAYLRQLQDRRPDDEADVEGNIAGNRYRSLAPEPEQRLVDAIRSGRITGLASPERSMHEE
ncbi:hypothetical protein ACEPAG_3358 [Sanghuangporus baumii]